MQGPVDALIALIDGREADGPGLTDQPGAILVPLASEHRVVSLLGDSLARLPGADPQTVAILDLQARHRYRVVENELQRVAQVADAVGVPIGVVKGVVNAERWFGEDPSTRPCSDIDLFLDPADVAGIERLLVALEPEHSLRGHAGELMASGVLPDIPITAGRVLIEIHANPLTLHLQPARVGAFWNTTVQTTTRLGSTIRCFDATTALLHAIINSAKDNHAFLLQVLEIGRALQDPAVDWARFEQIVADARWDSIVLDALRYVCVLLGLDMPTLSLRPDQVSVTVLRRIAPVNDRLGGFESWRRAQRFCKLDLAVPGGRVRTVRGIAGRTFSPDAYITAFAPDLTGPYPVRAAKFWVRRQQYVKGRRASLSGPLEHGGR